MKSLPLIAFLLVGSHVYSSTVYVALESPNPMPPYTNWATAARVIQDAVDVAVAGDDALVLVTNGVYDTGGREGSRVVVSKPLTVRSVNGPQHTIIEGYQVPNTIAGTGALRCVFLTNGATLSGLTLTNGAASDYGGGANGSDRSTVVVSNCIFAGNYSGSEGGGASGCHLINCLLTNNWSQSGGGAAESLLENCRLAGNRAQAGGGAFYCSLTNCVLWRNTSYTPDAQYITGAANGCALINCTVVDNRGSPGPGGVTDSLVYNSIIYSNGPSERDYSTWLFNSCAPEIHPDDQQSITNLPLFVDQQNGDLRLQSNSPCINAGNNAYLATGTDLDGNPRVSGGTVDMGAYEFQDPTSIISYAWLQQYGFPTDGSADFADPDHDGMNNWQEWRCGTDPTNAWSVLRLLSPSVTRTNVTVAWQSVTGVSYLLERSSDSSLPLHFLLLATGIPGNQGITSYTDTNAAGFKLLFYRVGVKGP